MSLFRGFGAFAASGNVFNEASGGDSTVEVADYLSTGQTWRVHTFTSNGTLTVVRSIPDREWNILLVAGGGGGAGLWGNNAQGYVGGSGGSGGVIWTRDSGAVTVNVDDYSIVVGSGGAGGANGTSGGNSTGFGLTAIGGGAGRQGAGLSGGSGGSSSWGTGDTGYPAGAGTTLQGHNGEGGASQGVVKDGGGAGSYEASTTFTASGRSINITGSAVTYAQFNTSQYGSGGQGRGYDAAGISGQAGVVIVAYQIA